MTSSRRRLYTSLFGIALWLPAVVFAQGVDFGASEVLPATEAYVPEASVGDDGRLVIDWTIEPGHYLYRDKTAFTLETADGELPLSSPDFPAALTEVDAFFGESAVYRGDTRMTVALLNRPSDAVKASLDVRFQGCADIGICYPPTTVALDLELPADEWPVLKQPILADEPLQESLDMASVGGSALTRSSLFANAPSSLSNSVSSSPISTRGVSSGLSFGSNNTEDLLRPEEAYMPIVVSASTTALEILWTIEPGYYLYRDKLEYRLDPMAPHLAVLERSEGSMEYDEFFGDTFVNREEARAVVALGEGFSVGDEATMYLSYQGCADIGVCFPPSKIGVPFVIASLGESVTPAVMTATVTPPLGGAGSGSAPVLVSEQDRLTGLLATNSLWLSVVTFFFLGLLLAFTPCVLPMVPILSSLIVGQRNEKGEPISSGRAFRLSLVYVTVMASTYAIAGVLVALSGQNVQIWLQDPIVLSLFAALFVVFALAMFGLFEFQVPQAVQSRLTAASNAQKGGGYRRVIGMGFLSTLIVGPCVTAPLAGALLYIADTGDAWVGGAALLALGFGMGAPLLLVGTSAATLLPKAGVWMVKVKQGFGFLMLAMAIYMLARFLSAEITAMLVGLLVLATGIWLGAADRLESNSGGWTRTAKGTGLALALYGTAVLLGAFGGGSSLMKPLAVYTGGNGGSSAGTGTQIAQVQGLVFQPVKSTDQLDQVVAQASAEGRPVMLDFYADWCVSCKEMEHFTFTDEQVQDSLDGVVLVQADVTENDDIDKALLDRFRLFAPPAIVFFDPAGNEVPGARVVGFVSAGQFSEHVDNVLATTTAQR